MPSLSTVSSQPAQATTSLDMDFESQSPYILSAPSRPAAAASNQLTPGCCSNLTTSGPALSPVNSSKVPLAKPDRLDPLTEDFNYLPMDISPSHNLTGKHLPVHVLKHKNLPVISET